MFSRSQFLRYSLFNTPTHFIDMRIVSLKYQNPNLLMCQCCLKTQNRTQLLLMIKTRSMHFPLLARKISIAILICSLQHFRNRIDKCFLRGKTMFDFQKLNLDNFKLVPLSKCLNKAFAVSNNQPY